MVIPSSVSWETTQAQESVRMLEKQDMISWSAIKSRFSWSAVKSSWDSAATAAADVMACSREVQLRENSSKILLSDPQQQRCFGMFAKPWLVVELARVQCVAASSAGWGWLAQGGWGRPQLRPRPVSEWDQLATGQSDGGGPGCQWAQLAKAPQQPTARQLHCSHQIRWLHPDNCQFETLSQTPELLCITLAWWWLCEMETKPMQGNKDDSGHGYTTRCENSEACEISCIMMAELRMLCVENANRNWSLIT